jgi:hypothetical protein
MDCDVQPDTGEAAVIRFVRKYRIVFRVGFLVLWIRLLLRTKRLPLVLDQLTPPSKSGMLNHTELKYLVYYVDRWLQLFPYNKKGNCFPRSLAIYWFARRLGYPVLFHCGVKKDVASLNGHAWLTLDHLPFHESDQHWHGYTVTFSYPQEVLRRDPPIRRRSNETKAS